MTKTTKVFWSGNSQAVRIPKEFSIQADEVEIRKRGNIIMLRPKRQTWAPLLESLGKFTDDFMAVRPTQPPFDKRSKPFR
jgi:antitoxin VapB